MSPHLSLAASCVGLALGAELAYPAVFQAADGEHTLTIGHVNFGAYGFATRGYNGGLPGPTFRMKPGETLQVNLVNDLVAANDVSCPDTDGEYCETATTNLHTHGLHVSSKGTENGWSYNSDNVFAEVKPGQSGSFKFAIPENHMGGTHWYHPHHHHATALQAGGGAAGVLIVDDPDGYLPEEYSSMPEKILFISGHNLVTLQAMGRSSESALWTTAVTDAQTAGLDTNAFFVNGQTGPTLTMDSHQWYRLRMVYAAVEQALTLSVTGDATCQLKLLAKDGIYLNTLPRDIPAVILYPGARADVAVSCTCTTYPCTAILGSAGGRRLQPRPPMGGGGAGPGGPGANMATVDLMELNIIEGSLTEVVELPVTAVTRPCYLIDLRSATVPTANSGTISLLGGQRAVQFNGQGQSMTYANTHAGGSSMTDWPALTTFTLGSIYELAVGGANAHPFHVHVVPYQIVNMPANSYNDGYFAIGDWHDTLMVTAVGGGTNINVRLLPDKFTGRMVVHCHILEHEDEGMMGFIQLDGTEGETYAAAATLDSTCYADAFAANSMSTASRTPTSTTSMSTASRTPTSTTSPSPSVDGACPSSRARSIFLAALASVAFNALMA